MATQKPQWPTTVRAWAEEIAHDFRLRLPILIDVAQAIALDANHASVTSDDVAEAARFVK